MYFLGNGNHQPQVGLHHFLLGLTCLLSRPSGPAARCAGTPRYRRRHTGRPVAISLTAAPRSSTRSFSISICQPRPVLLGHIRSSHVGIKLPAPILVDELAAVDPGLIRQLHHVELSIDMILPVDAVKLIDQGFDPVVMQMELELTSVDDFRPQLLIGRSRPSTEKLSSSFSVAEIRCVLHLAEHGQSHAGDPFSSDFKNAGLQRRFHGGKRHVGLRRHHRRRHRCWRSGCRRRPALLQRLPNCRCWSRIPAPPSTTGASTSSLVLFVIELSCRMSASRSITSRRQDVFIRASSSRQMVIA